MELHSTFEILNLIQLRIEWHHIDSDLVSFRFAICTEKYYIIDWCAFFGIFFDGLWFLWMRVWFYWFRMKSDFFFVVRLIHWRLLCAFSLALCAVWWMRFDNDFASLSLCLLRGWYHLGSIRVSKFIQEIYLYIVYFLFFLFLFHSYVHTHTQNYISELQSLNDLLYIRCAIIYSTCNVYCALYIISAVT